MKRIYLAAILVLYLPAIADAQPRLGGPVSPDGRVHVKIDFPLHLRQKNAGGTDGAGLCVFTSIEHSARWQLEPGLEDFQAIMRKEPGGGWPEKVDKMIEKYANGVDYAQYEGRDPEILKACLKGGRMPGVTYSGQDPHYKGWIAHMVNLVHFDDAWACILDNNFIGENELVWMRPSEFLDRWRGKGSGWAVILLRTPPNPPVTAKGPQQKPSNEDGGNTEPNKYTWFYHNKDPHRVYLYLGADLVGAYDYKDDYFRHYDHDADKWLSKTQAPFTPPPVKTGQESGIVGYAVNYGIPLHLFPPRGEADERYTRQGKSFSRDELLALLANPLPAVTATVIPLIVTASAAGAAYLAGRRKTKKNAQVLARVLHQHQTPR
jgi:hypothetical protein